jgi:hypothetical protein
MPAWDLAWKDICHVLGWDKNELPEQLDVGPLLCLPPQRVPGMSTPFSWTTLDHSGAGQSSLGRSLRFVSLSLSLHVFCSPSADYLNLVSRRRGSGRGMLEEGS